MKILNWVHWRLNGPTASVSLHPQIAGHVSMNNQEVEMKDRPMMKLSVQDREEALLGWEDGLLAIGTLGFHAHHPPHPDFIQNPRFSFRNSSNSVFDPRDSVSDDQEEYLDTTSYMEEMLAGENDEKPLIYNAYNHQEIEEPEDEMIAFAPFQHVEASDISRESVKSDRTTLADLFKADQNESVTIKKCSGSAFKDRVNKEDKQMMGKQEKFPTSFSAKLMMKKMMKRKIHPELPRQNSTSKTENYGMMPVPSKDEIQVNEVMALLP